MKTEDELFNMLDMELYWERLMTAQLLSVNTLCNNHDTDEVLKKYIKTIEDVWFLKNNHPQGK